MSNYGFVIDNRTCIGCHACTVACKSEHDVPIGVNRTHVKYVETGIFPNSTRLFSVHRCNHCEDAPCTTICPVTALYTRSDGIVDFDKERCIGCKSCMQACPYDALYIDPNNGTAAKCNYCAHRIENSHEPACVVVCPTQSIISGDLDDPHSEIAMRIAQNDVMVRKPEAETKPNLYYVKGNSEMLDPLATERTGGGMWSQQDLGVGHFAKYADSRLSEADTPSMLVQLALEKKARSSSSRDQAIIRDVAQRLAEDSPETKRVYDAPSKGILWGWEVTAYIWAKAISAGTYMIAMLLWLTGNLEMTDQLWMGVLGVSLAFLGLTGVFLILDLDRPERFLYVFLRPNWSSWLVRGAYIIGAYGAVLAATATVLLMGLDRVLLEYLAILGVPIAALTGVYTAWLFKQGRGRSWSTDKTLALKFMAEMTLVGVAVILPLASPSLLTATACVVVLVAAWKHGRHLVERPQLESLC